MIDVIKSLKLYFASHKIFFFRLKLYLSEFLLGPLLQNNLCSTYKPKEESEGPEVDLS